MSNWLIIFLIVSISIALLATLRGLSILTAPACVICGTQHQEALVKRGQHYYCFDHDHVHFWAADLDIIMPIIYRWVNEDWKHRWITEVSRGDDGKWVCSVTDTTEGRRTTGHGATMEDAFRSLAMELDRISRG